NTAVVQPFEAQIVADTGIEVALGMPDTGAGEDLFDLEWVTSLETADISAYITSAYGGGFRFNHVTTSDGVNFFTLGVAGLIGTSEGYLELPLHFRSNSANAINWSAVSLTGDSLSWVSDVEFMGATGVSYPSGSSFTVNAADSMRVAIQEVIGSRTTPAAIGYENAGGGSNIYLGDGSVHYYSDGVTAAPAHDFSDRTTLGDGLGAAGSYNYYHEKTGNLPVGSDAVNTMVTQVTVAGTQVLGMNSGSTASAGADYYGQIVIRIWLEGYDQNSYNSILARLVTASLTFEGITL
ncbi:MAG: hypothetical protein JXC31_05650, partial [Acholeplasmataceae bacterium]|nr:hypothetical protein [Acholeplasmataceae bacterium]